ncbi:MAG: 3-deoxy-manno-octulosonate cytidylyltransferase [Synergistaceae bacterium]|nr:3-deoxy-manno-octulosonate cytidylyltransferase [Synergistaceae bacterium]
MPDIKTLAVIPARLKSTRLDEKPLMKLAGRELVLRVLDGVRGSGRVDMTVVAADDERVISLVEREGGTAMMTPSDLPTGGDRVAWVARRVPSRFVINVQGDDPLVTASVIDPMIDALEEDESAGLVLLAKRIDREDEVKRDSIVKMVFDLEGNALYFSRSPVPFVRNPGTAQGEYYKHIGPYAWRRDTLLEFASWEQTPLERAESLEMLRILERGGRIKCVKTGIDSIEIDTPDDVEKFIHHINQRGGH